MNILKKYKILEAMAKLYHLTFDVEVDPTEIMIVNIFFDPNLFVTCFSFLVDNTYVVFYKVDEGDKAHGVVLDLMYMYAAEMAGMLQEDHVHYVGSKIALLIPQSPLGLSRKEETYEQSRFSPVEGPSDQELKELKLSPQYTVFALDQNPRIEELFDLIIKQLEDEVE